MECHALGKPQPLKDAHPRKDQCIDCHKIEKTKKTMTVDHS